MRTFTTALACRVNHRLNEFRFCSDFGLNWFNFSSDNYLNSRNSRLLSELSLNYFFSFLKFSSSDLVQTRFWTWSESGILGRPLVLQMYKFRSRQKETALFVPPLYFRKNLITFLKYFFWKIRISSFEFISAT